ncbi:hypothetical protein EB796_011890 [Bugula neritina]|uniref:Uncharacterized protein n=1 Tax=Bugula neritina TaxID=10212 RepID=A0A7J7JTU4_BUGNE|nr:hypothetical protein EB796_011890 [Bugula neritina]
MNGLLIFLNLLQSLANCITLKETLYVHRTRPGLLVQEVSFYNPTDKNIEVSVTQDILSSWATEHSPIEHMKDNSEADADSGTKWHIGSKTLSKQVLLTVAGREFSRTGIMELPAKKTVLRHSLTVFDYTVMENKGDKSVTQKTIRDRKSRCVKAVKSALHAGSSDLYEQHTLAWHQLWQSGFAISDSKAPDSLNSDVINSTLYYILSHVSSTLQDLTSSPSEVSQAMTYLNKPRACYHNSHHTLQFSSLWQIGETVEAMNKGVDTHLSSLEHYGCSNYIKAGAEGVLQAVLLSLGGLSFRESNDKVVHMEFNVDPADLHRDYQFTNIRYADKTFLNISVIVDESNHAVLHVSSSADNFYGTDAGLAEPVLLSQKTQTFPVKLTKPLTAILYVSDSKKHLDSLRKIVQHVEVPVLAPAQDHRVLARHKHGHSYGGLPAIFWVILALLIVTFHFFLFKMIFSELCKSDSGHYYRRRALS